MPLQSHKERLEECVANLEAKCEALEAERDKAVNRKDYWVGEAISTQAKVFALQPVAFAAVRAQITGTRFPMELCDAVGEFREYLGAQKAAEATDATTEPTRELDVDVIEFRFPRAPETIREAADGALEEYGLTDREAEWSRKYGLHLCAEVRRLRAELEAQNEWHPASEPPEAGVPIEIGEVDGRGRWDVDFGFFDGEDETYHASNGDPIPFAKYWRVFPTPPKGASIDV